MEFVKLLKEWKDQVGWTDEQIADAMEPPVSRSTVNQWLNNKHPPDLSNLPALAKLLGRDWVDLAVMILGDRAGRVGGMSQAQAALMAQTSGLSDDDLKKLMAVVEALYPRKPNSD